MGTIILVVFGFATLAVLYYMCHRRFHPLCNDCGRPMIYTNLGMSDAYNYRYVCTNCPNERPVFLGTIDGQQYSVVLPTPEWSAWRNGRDYYHRPVSGGVQRVFFDASHFVVWWDKLLKQNGIAPKKGE